MDRDDDLLREAEDMLNANPVIQEMLEMQQRWAKQSAAKRESELRRGFPQLKATKQPAPLPGQKTLEFV